MQRNVTEDAASSGDDVTAAHSCLQAALGRDRQASPGMHSLTPALMQGTVDPIQPDGVQLYKLHTACQCDTSDEHLCSVFCSRTAEWLATAIIILDFMQAKLKCSDPRSHQKQSWD